MVKTTNKTNKRVTVLTAILAVFCLAVMSAQPANASPITGEVAFVGTFLATGGSGPLDLENATGIDFTFGFVAQATGDFNPSNLVMPFMSPVTLNDFTFAPFSGPVDPLWAVGVFSFALQSLTTVAQGEGYLALGGTGVVTASKAGLDATVFNWSFSGDNSGGTLQLFSSSGSPTALPEPSELLTFAFLAMSVGALCVWSRGHRQAIQ
jgi:hypothetical protein